MTRVLAPLFRVPGHDLDDVRQVARMACVEALPRFKPAAGQLRGFLMAHTRNRLTNFVRDHGRRADSPCRQCHRGQPCGEDGKCCPKHLAWDRLQRCKTSVSRPLPLDESEPRQADESPVEAEVELRELLARIDERLPVDLRSAYLSMKAGQSVPRALRAAVVASVRAILGSDVEAA